MNDQNPINCNFHIRIDYLLWDFWAMETIVVEFFFSFRDDRTKCAKSQMANFQFYTDQTHIILLKF